MISLRVVNKQKLQRLGIRLANEGGFCTHLAAAQIVRTEKFLCALAYAPVVVSLKWVEDCIAKDSLLGIVHHSVLAHNISKGLSITRPY